MNEKFGVELEIITSKFSAKMIEIKNSTKLFGEKIKQNLQTGMYMDLGESKKELTSVQKQLDRLKGYNYDLFNLDNGKIVNTKQHISDLSATMNALKQDINTMETSKIAKIGQVFNSIKVPIEKMRTNISKSNLEVDKLSNNIKKSFSSGINTIKRFALSLFGIRAIWTAVSRASSAYLSQDIEMSNKLQAVWVAFGSMLSPIIEKIINAMLRLVGYVNIFIKALTGKDLLSSAMDKANKSTQKTIGSVKKLQGMLGSFDEINNIAQDDSSGAGGVDTPDLSWVDAIKGVQLNPEIEATIKRIGSFISDNFPLIRDVIIAIGIAFASWKLAGIVSALTGIGMLPIFKMLAGLGITIWGLIEGFNLFKDLLTGKIDPSLTSFGENLGNLLKVLGLIAIGVGLVFGIIPGLIAALIVAVGFLITWLVQNWEAFTVGLKFMLISLGDFIIYKILIPIGDFIVNTFTTAWNGIKSVFSAVGSFFVGVLNTIKDIFTNIGLTIGSAIGNAFKYVVNSILTFAENTINGFIKAINGAISLINNIPGVNISKINLLNIPKLATGTNYVPSDQLAYIHKGEAVVPKKFNSGEYFGKDNDETNNLLRNLIDTLENKDMNAYIDSDSVGRTAKNWINTKSRVLGRSVIV